MTAIDIARDEKEERVGAGFFARGTDGQYHPDPPPVAPASVRTLDAACLECGQTFTLNPCHASEHRFCKPTCRAKWRREHPHPRQRLLDFAPALAPLPPVVDQRVPPEQRLKLRRMAQVILARVERGPARASELHAMFPGARSVRTRISEVGRFVGSAWRSEPVRGVVGEWLYQIVER